MNYAKSINRVFLYTVLVNILGSLVISVLPLPTHIILLMSQLMLVAPGMLFILKHKLNLKDTIRFHKIKISNIVLILVFTYLVSPTMNVINMISMLFVKNVIQDTLGGIVGNNLFIVSLTLIAIIPCILEESIYRGFFYNEYRRVNVLRGMLLSAFLFGIMHMNFNQFFYAFVMGILFVLLIEATDSILAPMIVHFCINGYSTLMLFLLPKIVKLMERFSPGYSEQFQQSMNEGMDKSQILDILPYNILWAVITLALACYVFKIIATNSGRLEHIKDIIKRKPEGQKEGMISIPLIIGIAICIGFMVLNELPV